MNKNSNYSNAKYFKIMLHGEWYEILPGDSETLKFCTLYYIVADNEDEALEIIKYFEPCKVHASLAIKILEIIKKFSNQPKGVYYTSEYFMYKDSDDDE